MSGYLLVWSTAGLAVAMYMAYASFVVLQVVCVLCVVVYVAVVGIFIVSGIGESTPVRQLPVAAVADLINAIQSEGAAASGAPQEALPSLVAAFDRLRRLLRMRDVRIERDDVHGPDARGVLGPARRRRLRICGRGRMRPGVSRRGVFVRRGLRCYRRTLVPLARPTARRRPR
mgnify:CR=1 FL=1